MTNHTATPRPMLAFTWEDGGSTVADPSASTAARSGSCPTGSSSHRWVDSRERLFVKVPAAYGALCLLRSLVDKEY